MQEINTLKSLLVKEFETKDLGNLRYFLGKEIAQSNARISISQQKLYTNPSKKKLECSNSSQQTFSYTQQLD